MKRIVLFFLVIVLTACEKSKVEQGRDAYKKYFKEVLRDPESLVIHHETFHYMEDGERVDFEVEYGATNGYGGMVRETIKFRTTHKPYIIEVNGEDHILRD